jgi:hypothetical protein
VKDFDVLLAKDREFKVGGETFHWRDQRPEALEEFSDQTKLEGWPLMDAQIMLFIVPDEHDRWKTLRGRDENPVTMAQLGAIITWLVEQQSSFPTVQPSPSVVGRGQTAATSKAA